MKDWPGVVREQSEKFSDPPRPLKCYRVNVDLSPYSSTGHNYPDFFIVFARSPEEAQELAAQDPEAQHREPEGSPYRWTWGGVEEIPIKQGVVGVALNCC